VSSTTLRSAEPHREAHRETNSLRDVILGGQDGLVNILGIVLGVIAGGGSTGEGRTRRSRSLVIGAARASRWS
jgi:hypothetical protein